MGGFHFYILASRNGGALYAGVTSDLSRRLEQHGTTRSRRAFTARYNPDRLVHVEVYDDPETAVRGRSA